MIKTLTVAWRDFLATVATKGFILGLLLPPIIMGGALTLIPLLMNQASPKVQGTVAIIDKTGVLQQRLGTAFDPERAGERRRRRRERDMERAREVMPVQTPQSQQAMQMTAAIDKPADLKIEYLLADSDVEQEKKPILSTDVRSDQRRADARLALVVIPAESIRPSDKGEFSPYQFFVAPKLDPEVQDDIRDQIGRAIVDQRLQTAGMDPSQVRGLTQAPWAQTRVVTAQGEQKDSQVAAMLIPVAFMTLLWISVFTGGQYLLTSTVEEKSNRVMEVLLSAVSPMQLMVGKILGQMAASLLILVLYSGAGVAGMIYANQNHLLDPWLFVYVGVYFFIAFFLIAAMMAAIGSAVNDMREAQALLGPVMIALVIPMALWLPLSRNPNSVFAQVCSFLPPISPFVMVIRLAGSEKIPFWQIPASIAVGLLAVWIAAWAAAKVFRIGILMYGKPPNLRTLIRWIRLA